MILIVLQLTPSLFPILILETVINLRTKFDANKIDTQFCQV